jgi:RNA-directed DNA polymerase
LCFFRDRAGEVRVTVDPVALMRAEDRVWRLTTRNWGASMERKVREISGFAVAWTAHCRSGDTVLPFEGRDKWLRRRLGQVRSEESKRPQRY